MMHRRMGGLGALVAVLAGVVAVGGCGYHFPADQPNLGHGRWLNTALRVETSKEGLNATQRSENAMNAESFRTGPGNAHAEARLPRILDGILTTRMGPFATASGRENRVLRVRMEAVSRELIQEDNSGRANQYRVTITAQPTLEVDGKPQTPGYPPARGVATYYEPASGTASQAARIRAETEAMNLLADALVAMMAEDFPPVVRTGTPKPAP